jgi:FkbM family methyltransferase
MSRGWNARRLDLIEVFLLLAFVGISVWFASGYLRVHPEAAWLRAHYGPERHSEHSEEWVIRSFFDERPGGFFVDVGANHFRRFSNTYYLEKELGWSGIAVEPLKQFEADYREHRPRTDFFSYFVSDTSDSDTKMFTLESEPLVSSGEKTFTQRWGEDVVELSVPTITLNDLLDKEGVTSIDFLSMDIELSEPQALAGFDIDRFRPALVGIEAHLEVRQQILNYFAEHDYVIVGAYLRADTENLYFAPLPG